MSKSELNDTNTGVADQSLPSDSVYEHACVTLNMTDRLRLIRFPPAIIDLVRQALLSSWPRGLQNEREYAGAYEFKLSGNPWRGQGIEGVESRLMMASVLSALHHQGWYLLAPTNVSKKQQDMDALIFQHGVPPPLTSFFAVSFNEQEKLRLIDAPPEIISAVQQVFSLREIQHEEWLYSRQAYQFKLCGRPWSAEGEEAVTSRIKLLTLLDAFAVFGWKLHGSIDMSTGHESCAIDTWFFRRSGP